MNSLCVYLTFNGNCFEAMNFYKRCLGGKLAFQSVGNTPMAERLPGRFRKLILQATLRFGDQVLIATDLVGETELRKGNTVSLMVSCSSEEEVRRYYSKLSKGGLPTNPPEPNFWGGLFGDLTDKFGNQWLLYYQKK